jgi:hypothetical protein
MAVRCIHIDPQPPTWDQYLPMEVEVVQRSASHAGPAETLPIERYRPGAMAMKQTRLLDKLYQHC